MFDRVKKNTRIALIACAAAVAACENPGPDAYDSEGAAGSAAVTRKGPSGAEVSVSAAKDAMGTVAGAAVFRSKPPACTEKASPAANGCDGRMAGIYAIQTTYDVTWSDDASPAPAYDEGRGTLTAVLLGELAGLCPGQTDAELAFRMCDLKLPVVHVQEDQGLVQYFFPESTWDSSRMPALAAHVAARGTSQLAIEPARVRLGIEVGPIDTWPEYKETATLSCAAGEGEACFPDQDEDGQPGLSLRVQPADSESAIGRAHHTPAPTDDGYLHVGSGATQLFAGLETTIGAKYDLESDCDEGTGVATPADFKLRAYDCVLEDGSSCTYNAATVVDRNLPVFHALKDGEAPKADVSDRSPSAGPRTTLVRLGDDGDAIGCNDAREAFANR